MLIHIHKENGLSSECGQIIVFKCDLYENDDSHTSKENGCSQVYLQMFLPKEKREKYNQHMPYFQGMSIQIGISA